MKKDVKEVNISNIDYIIGYIFCNYTTLVMIYTYFIFISHKDEEKKSKLVGNPKQCDWKVSTIRCIRYLCTVGLYIWISIHDKLKHT